MTGQCLGAKYEMASLEGSPVALITLGGGESKRRVIVAVDPNPVLPPAPGGEEVDPLGVGPDQLLPLGRAHGHLSRIKVLLTQLPLRSDG